MHIPEPFWYMLGAGLLSLPLCFVLLKMAGAIHEASGATHRASERERRDYFRMIERATEKATLPASYAATLHAQEAANNRQIDAAVERDLGVRSVADQRPGQVLDFGAVFDERSEMEEAGDPATAQTG